MMDVNELNKIWKGKYIRTDRILTLEEWVELVDNPLAPWYEGYSIGINGIVESFKVINGKIWIEVDGGFMYIIDEKTTIAEIEPEV
ncbi:MAG: hypothetical protein LC778_10355 [Acidobacteria bacterium]|nr:hypothetical protein [Acidobacteriota bacterium]